jgi:hypothetical protein
MHCSDTSGIGVSGHCADCREVCGYNLVTPRFSATGAATPAAWRCWRRCKAGLLPERVEQIGDEALEGHVTPRGLGAQAYDDCMVD